MRPIQNSETDPSTPAPEKSEPDAHEGPTKVGPMSAAIAKLIEAERERARADERGVHDKDSTKSGVRPAITDAEEEGSGGGSAASPKNAEEEGELATPRNDEAPSEYDATLFNPLAMELMKVLQETEPAAADGLDVVREMEEADAAAPTKANDPSGSSSPAGLSGLSPPARRPSIPRPKITAPAMLRAPPSPIGTGALAASPIPAALPSNESEKRDDAATENATEKTPVPIAEGSRPMQRVAFPEWVGLSVHADELVGHRPKRDRRQMILIAAGVGVGVVTIVVGIVWWLL